jgi:hypothetical protein
VVATTPGAAAAFLLEERAEGWPLGELLQHLARETDVVIEPADSVDAALLERKVEFVGPLSIPRDRALEWLQAVLGFYRLAMVPVGPPAEPRFAVIRTPGL